MFRSMIRQAQEIRLEAHRQRQTPTAACGACRISACRLMSRKIRAFSLRSGARKARLTRSADGRSTRAQIWLLAQKPGSQSHIEASVFGREIPELRLDRMLEPDWLEPPEPESKGSGYQNNLAHGTVALAIRSEFDSFRFHDFEHHDDRPLTKTIHRLACHGETNSFRKRPPRMTAKLLPPGKLLPPSPNADQPSASDLHPGAYSD